LDSGDSEQDDCAGRDDGAAAKLRVHDFDLPESFWTDAFTAKPCGVRLRLAPRGRDEFVPEARQEGSAMRFCKI
jgi:hypothetical protein